ncbi:MAG: heme exporter protein CcmD [Pseudomonadota bacterium]
MSVELGKYAGYILSAYGVTFVALGAITLASVLRARRVRSELADMEAERADAEATVAPQEEVRAHG